MLIKYFSAIIDKKVKKGEEKIKETQVEHLELGSIQLLKDVHPYFTKIDNLIEIKLPITRIGGPVRTLIFRDILKIFYETAKAVNIKLLEQKDKVIEIQNKRRRLYIINFAFLILLLSN